MDRVRLSSTVFLLIVLLFIISCEHSNDIKQLGSSSDSLLTLINEYPIPKLSLLSGTTYLFSNNNDNFYFSNLFAREIYQTKRPFIHFEKIGKRGNGPSEYSTPYYIQLFKNTLFFSDVNNINIKSLTFNEITSEENQHVFSGGFGGQKFAVDDNFLYVLNKKSPLLNVYSRKSGEIVKSLIETNKKFDFVNMSVQGGGIVIDLNKNLFLMSVVPFKIWNLTLKNDQPLIINEWDFVNRLGFDFNATEINQSLLSKNKKPSGDLINSFPKAVNIYLIGVKDEKLIVHHLYQGKSIYHIITKSGQLVNTVESSTKFLIGTSGNQLFFFNKSGSNDCNDCFTINEYILNE